MNWPAGNDGVAFDRASINGVRVRVDSIGRWCVGHGMEKGWTEAEEQLWASVPCSFTRSWRKAMRRFYGHHLPKRLRPTR